MQISNKLLGAVLERELMGYEVLISGLGDQEIYHINYDYFGMPKGYFINVHALTHKIKVWAWRTKQVTIRSGYAEHGAWANFSHDTRSVCSMDLPLTEPEAVARIAELLLEGK